MSAVNVGALGLSAVASLGLAELRSVFSTSPKRAILWNASDPAGNTIVGANGQPVPAILTPQVVLSERHHDALRITDHPVEQGAAVSDHAYKLPAEVEIRGGWSFAAGDFQGPIPRFTDSSLLSSLYAVLLQLQSNRVLVTLVTGKRTYPAMLLESLGVSTDEKSENTLMFVANFRQLFIVQTHIVSVPPANVMANPEITGATTDIGQTQLGGGGSINPGAANTILGGAPTGPGILGGG